MSTETNFSTTDTTTYGFPLEERYRLQLEACVDYYCTQLGYKFEIDKRNVKIREMNAQIEAKKALLEEKDSAIEITEFAIQVQKKALEAKKASLQILSCITIET